MKYLTAILPVLLIGLTVSCNHSGQSGTDGEAGSRTSAFIPDARVETVINLLKDSLGEAHAFRIERGVRQTASLWQETDGTAEDFALFCKNSFIDDPAALSRLFNTLERNFEVIGGYYHRMDVMLKAPLQLEGPEITPADMQFGGYDASAHLTDDLYANRIAFLTVLNFPFYTLAEKTASGEKWSRREWAYARLGDRFTSRVPAAVQQDISRTVTEADAYISDYNIYMGNLRNENGEQLFPTGMKLISHWGLRDELKSNYADSERGLEKQRMIYRVMQRIIDQSIPREVINSDSYLWTPATNALHDSNGAAAASTPEDVRRYEVFLKNFRTMRRLDPHSPHYPTQLVRAFEGTMEVPQKDVEDLFRQLLSSPQVKEVATFIESRLGRKLEPFDIWYSGFKSGVTIPEEDLTAITTRKYPSAEALKGDLPNMLVKLGWESSRANRITSLVTVEASRGAGHAWGAEMRDDMSRLRTRIGAEGLDYKGYNIAVHEFGHNVEQTVTMNDVDHYMLNGVPNTAFTEAVAFLFQKRDLELLGVMNPNREDEYYLALDNFWSCYEIMGVSLVDIQVWEWLYAHPEATPGELKEAVTAASREVWNRYYAGVLGGRDEILLGIYSHMIDYPLYLPNYPMGHLIAFQIERQVRGKNLAGEIDRMYTQGRIIPQLWMKNSVGSPISVAPLLSATDEALQVLKH
jgi:hypothetical protein